ncbi:MAG: nucleotidyltransferase domain-containing protein [bacterium]
MKFQNQDTIETSALKINNKLEPTIWDNEYLINEKIRQNLLNIAKLFIKTLKLKPDTEISDIIITGSIANYNWTKHSDVDVHIVIDFSKINIPNQELIKEYFNAKKENFNTKYDFKIKGHDVEMYVQDVNEIHHATGIYSLLKDKWIRIPKKNLVIIDRNSIMKKATYIMKYVDNLHLSDPDLLQKIEKIKDKIKLMRQCGLENTGEYSVENLVFKILRNNGYLEKLNNLKEKKLEKELSVESKQI